MKRSQLNLKVNYVPPTPIQGDIFLDSLAELFATALFSATRELPEALNKARELTTAGITTVDADRQKKIDEINKLQEQLNKLMAEVA